MGRSDDPFLLAGESGYDEREVLPAARREGDEVALSVAATMKLGLHFWSRRLRGRARVADEAIEHIGGMVGTAICTLIHLTGALSRIQVAPNDRSTARFVRQSTGLAPQVGGGRTGKLRGTVCADPGCVGASARAAQQGGALPRTGRSSSPRSTSSP